MKFSNANFLKRLVWEPASSGDLYPHLYNGSLDIKDIESFELRDSSNKEPSSQKCIGLSEAQVIIRQYMSSLVGAKFNEDFPWLLEERQITAEHVSWAFSGLSWSRNQSKYLTGALVSQDIVDLGPAEWGEYSVDCQGVIRAEYFSE